MSLSMNEILGELVDTSLEVTVHLNSGMILRGQIETSSELTKISPFYLRSHEISQTPRIHFFDGNSVSSVSVEDEVALKFLLSKKRFEDRQKPAPTALEFKRQLSVVSAELSGLQFQVMDVETLDDECRRNLQDVIEKTVQAFKKMASDPLGREAVKSIQEFKFVHHSKSELHLQRTGMSWAFVMDLRSISQLARIQPDMIQKQIESQIQ